MSVPSPFSHDEWLAILLCVGFAGNEAAEGRTPSEALTLAIAAREALKRVLGEELLRQMKDDKVMMEAVIRTRDSISSILSQTVRSIDQPLP